LLFCRTEETRKERWLLIFARIFTFLQLVSAKTIKVARIVEGMGAPKKADWREERRKRAWDLKELGWKQQDIAVALGVSEGAVSQWLKRGREGGMEALKTHAAKGLVPRLTIEQKAQIPRLLAQGAEAYGFCGDTWTASRVAEVIEKAFGVRYHRDHVSRLLRDEGWIRQQS
jgi:transposase